MPQHTADVEIIDRDGAPPADAARLHELVFSAMAAKVLCASAELGVTDTLAGGARTGADIARRLGAHEPSLRRLLRAAVGLGVLAQPEPDRFELTALGRLLCTDSPDSARSLVTMLCGPEYWRTWGEIVPGMRSGERAWDLAHGASWLEFYERNPGPAATFNRAMAEHTRDAAPGLVAALDLERYGTVMDVGGGDGTLVAEILQAHPHLEGHVFDLPDAVASCATVVEAAGVSERTRVTAGDFFSFVPEGADAYLLKQVLHDWDDDRAVAILRNVRSAIAPGGRLLILERMLPELVGPDDARVLLIDMLMLLVTGGRERTQREFGGLLAAAGFQLESVTEPIPPFDYRVIEAAPLT